MKTNSAFKRKRLKDVTTHARRLVPETSALDHSAKLPCKWDDLIEAFTNINLTFI